MDPRMLVRLCGALGGLVWLARWVLAGQDAGDGAVGATYWAGLALLAIGLAGSGAGLVSARTPWLRALVAVCLPVLAGSVLTVLHDAAEDARVDGVLGVLALLVWVPLVLRSRRARPRPHAGAHAA